MVRCQACNKFKPLDRAHIKTKGSGGTWDDDNILMLCRECHQKQHYIGFFKLCKLYPSLEEILNEKGWFFNHHFGVTKLRKK